MLENLLIKCLASPICQRNERLNFPIPTHDYGHANDDAEDANGDSEEY